MWENEFICLAKCGLTIPPSPMEKAELINADLDPRKLSLGLVKSKSGKCRVYV